MDTKKAILIYQYSAKIKSELIIVSRLLAEMDSLEGEERKGAEKKVIEAIGRMKLFEHSKTSRCTSDALSLVTTSCQGAMKVLMDVYLI